ncbi:MAG: tetratricopeptide repeat protein [Timaviella obliquedivisa GSE-PSE-MK23-08B]|jgi:tetratricopeptide (TPR) repeat protein|nr:tetratricopeptide repeat protein [Timaviella obliquedivisa GSE-PSE-MK23-08B]
MLSNNPSKPSKPFKPSKISLGNLFLSKQAEAQQFLALNSSSLAELLTFIDFAENLAIAFVEMNFPADANALIEALQNHPQCQDIQFVVFDFSQQPELRFLRDELIQRLATVPCDQNKKLVLVIRGLERAIGISGNDPPVLQDLNFIRDAYKTSVPYPMLFILPDYALTRLAKFAPDFWAWRSGVFQFQTTPKTRDDALKFLEPEMVDRRYDRPVSPERIETLERLLMEYHPSGQAIASDNLGTCGDILHQLGVAYLSQNNSGKAGEYLVEALKLAEQREDLSLQARVKSDLGEAYLRLRYFEEAIAYVQQALDIQEQLDNSQGKAESLKIQGAAYFLLERYEEAIASFNQSIQIKPDDRYAWYRRGKTLHSLGRYEESIASYQTSLEISREIGVRNHEAILLFKLAHTFSKLDRKQESIQHYQDARQLFQAIGLEEEVKNCEHAIASLESSN